MNRDIVEACQKGDRSAQKAFFEYYLGSMLALCKRYVKDGHDAEELALSGFYKLFAGIGRFSYIDERGTRGWVKKIIVNECLMFLRKQGNVIFTAEALAAEHPLDSRALDRLNADDLLKLIDTLPDGYRIVFNMYAIEGYDHSEIARVLGISESTSRSQLARARAILQKLLKENSIAYEPR